MAKQQAIPIRFSIKKNTLRLEENSGFIFLFIRNVTIIAAILSTNKGIRMVRAKWSVSILERPP